MSKTLSAEISATVLAVDDDSAMLASVTRVLRRSKIGVHAAKNGKAALRALDHWMPELVLLDVSMPHMSGQAFLRRFREKEAQINQAAGSNALPVPVIFLTAQAGHRQRIDGLNAGAVDYITKPFDPEELRARVCAQLRHHRKTQSPIQPIADSSPTPLSGAAA
ncbi:MAG: response regulator transcription factor [Planctomycetota bacterium]